MTFRRIQLAGRLLVMTFIVLKIGSFYPGYGPAMTFYCLLVHALLLLDYANNRP